MKERYSTPHAIAQTITHPQTSLTGARRFYASAGVVVYADERLGMANVARRTWLAPGATRRLSTFLDMITPAVGGLLMAPAGVQPPQLDLGGPATAAERLRELAEAHLQQSIEPHRMTLCALDDSPDPNWDWSGVVVYDRPYRLRTGEYVTSRPHAVFHVRGDTRSIRAHVLVEIQHAADFEHVHKWIAALLPATERWSVVPVALLDDRTRHEEIRAVVDAIGAGGQVMAAHPHTQRARAKDADAQLVEFVRHMKEARYSTSIQGLDSLIDRAENVDHAILSAFDLYHWWGTNKQRVAARVRLKQHGTEPLTIDWGAVREPRSAAGVPLPEPVTLSSEGWDSMTSVAWSDDDRMAHLRRLWFRLVGAVQEGADSVAA
ncbi:MAG: hypothetical protein V7607_2602 [Solirubrobacteraceae bacterium]